MAKEIVPISHGATSENSFFQPTKPGIYQVPPEAQDLFNRLQKTFQEARLNAPSFNLLPRRGSSDREKAPKPLGEGDWAIGQEAGKTDNNTELPQQEGTIIGKGQGSSVNPEETWHLVRQSDQGPYEEFNIYREGARRKSVPEEYQQGEQIVKGYLNGNKQEETYEPTGDTTEVKKLVEESDGSISPID